MAYLKSTQVKVYPSAYRGVNADKKLFNPEAQLNTEFNITNLQASTPYRSYVLSGYRNSSVPLRCVIRGYYFELTLDDTTLAQFEKSTEISSIYASIVVKAATDIDDETNTKYAAYTLVPYTQSTIGVPTSSLDEKQGDDYVFTGLVLTDDIPTDATASLLILQKQVGANRWVVPSTSRCRFDTAQILDYTDGDPISESFTTNNISTTTLNVSGDTTTQGDVNIQGELVVAGETTLSDGLSVQGSINVSQGTLTADGLDITEDGSITNLESDSVTTNVIYPQGSNTEIGRGQSDGDRFDKIYGKDIYATKFHGELDGNVPTLESEIDSTKSSLLISDETPISLSTAGSAKILDSVSYTRRYSFHLMLEDTDHKINASGSGHNSIIVDLGQVCWGVRELLGGSTGNPYGINFHVQVYGQQADLLNATYTSTYEYIVDIYDVEVSSSVYSLYADVYWRDASYVSKYSETTAQKNKWQKLTSGNLYISSPIE